MHIWLHAFQETLKVDINSVLNYLLPPKRNLEAVDKLRNIKPYELIKTHTNRFKKSFILSVLELYSRPNIWHCIQPSYFSVFVDFNSFIFIVFSIVLNAFLLSVLV